MDETVFWTYFWNRCIDLKPLHLRPCPHGPKKIFFFFPPSSSALFQEYYQNAIDHISGLQVSARGGAMASSFGKVCGFAIHTRTFSDFSTLTPGFKKVRFQALRFQDPCGRSAKTIQYMCVFARKHKRVWTASQSQLYFSWHQRREVNFYGGPPT